MRTTLAVVLVTLAGCLSPSLTVCDDGIACSTQLVCAPRGGGCVMPEQIAACVALDDGVACGLPDGTTGSCHAQVCKTPRCGDSVLDAGEVCDDGNNIGGDGCNGSCTSTETCGNGIVEYAEDCDCGDAEHPGPAACSGTFNGGDFCSASCHIAYCGNGFVDPGEECDDGNFVSTDTCLVSCRHARCGDGVVAPNEGCDDFANGDNFDGCMDNCQECGPDAGQSSSTYDPATHSCVIVFDDKLYTFEDANAECQSLGGELPFIQNITVNQALAAVTSPAEQVQGAPLGVWIGVHFELQSDGTYTLQWMDGMPFVEGVSYHAWPYAEASVTLTVHLETNGYRCNALIGETASWQDSDCGDERLLACQLPKSAW